MIIDCHYYLESRLLTVEEMLSRMDAAGIHKSALMGAMTDPIPETAKPLVSLLQLLLARRSYNPSRAYVKNRDLWKSAPQKQTVEHT